MKRIGMCAVLCLALGELASVSAVAAAGSAGAGAPLPVTLDELLSPTSKATTKVNPLRAQMLTEGAYTVGFRGGMASRAAQLTTGLRARSDSLDRMFQFGPLISRNGTTAPVIVHGQDIAAFAADQVRTGNHVYRIEREERFVSVPPTWRDYLFIGLIARGGDGLPDFHSRPIDEHELKLWREAVRSGWNAGVAQADAILEANFNRLTRDLTGMILYSTLLQQGMISSTRVAETAQTVTGDGKQIVIGDTLRRLTGRAAFDTDYRNWIPTVSYGPAAPAATPAVPPQVSNYRPAKR